MTIPELRVLGFEMARISEVYLSRLAELMRPYGLDRYFTPFLWISRNSGAITQKELGEILKRDKVHTTRIVDHLCECGLVARITDPQDRRCHLLEITPTAQRILPEVERAVKEVNEFIMKGFAYGERLRFEDDLKTVYHYIDQQPLPDYIIQTVKNRPE